ncbi:MULTISPECIES: sugar phosphate isomerase/epimerase [unclassified Leptolyngbya]|uniref:sugar phosphate isomerase/epimerase family protein n=1 Tax=unclassified Leptolyngbya TaxID=2650499 RepID=UPI0016865A6D|nr:MULTISPECIES: sugar phosphate isomerase/epimerase [unclassified Leptolyngbya]MBD1909138.1 sugar phosphate isomerase/epimerase [Leptolyngbya sp. FACHB-8]MBD2157512.1 sugar phosphate isomerase/epimerase [Leptolyngbya sp. FACHB-16]
MNQIGVHALVWVGGWSEEECRQAIENSKTAGFDLIEIPVLDPATIDIDMTRQVLQSVGLKAGCSLGLSFETDISSADPAVVAGGDRLLHEALDVARGIGAEYLGGVIYSALGKYSHMPTPEGRANCVNVLRDLAREAAQDGITLGLETVNRYESNLLNTAAQTLELIEDINEDNVVVHLDTYHMNIEEANFRIPVMACGDRLGYVHIGESHRGYLGTGTVDFADLFNALATINYQGTITFESFSSAVVAPNLSTTLAIWRNLWSDGMDLARHARQFIDEGLQKSSRSLAEANP